MIFCFDVCNFDKNCACTCAGKRNVVTNPCKCVRAVCEWVCVGVRGVWGVRGVECGCGVVWCGVGGVRWTFLVERAKRFSLHEVTAQKCFAKTNLLICF